MIGRIYIIMGKSGSGKDTILKGILEKKPDLIKMSQYTNRPKRDGEIDGVEYNFTDIIHDNAIDLRSYITIDNLKWCYWYNDEFDYDSDTIKNYILIGTIDTYNNFIKYKNGILKKHIIPIYIDIDDEGELLHRLIKREYSQKCQNFKEICRRFIADSDDFSDENLEKIPNLNIVSNKLYVEDTIDNIINKYMTKPKIDKEKLKLLLNTFKELNDRLEILHKQISDNEAKQKILKDELTKLEIKLDIMRSNNE